MTEPWSTVSERVSLDRFEYPRGVIECEVERVQKMIEKRKFFGTEAEDAGMDVRLAKVSHIVTELAFRGDELRVTAEVLEDMEKGKDLARACDRAVAFPDLFEVCWGPVGCGTVSSEKEKTVIQDDYVLIQISWWFQAKNEAEPREA